MSAPGPGAGALGRAPWMLPMVQERTGPCVSVRMTAVDHGNRRERPDEVVGEEPLEIRVGGPGDAPASAGVTMRTPGHDFELAVGFLVSEGLIIDQLDVRTVRYCALPGGEPQRYNVVTVDTRRPVAVRGQRASMMTASCGICGTATLDQLARRCEPVRPGPVTTTEVLTALPGALRRRQRIFDRTGGLHAAGLFDVRSGALHAVREDIGRHNAVDKLVGWAALQRRLPLADAGLVVSGRVSFEIVQKAAVAGIPVVVAVSAPSSLAVSTARHLGITLAAFVREGRANLYAHPERIQDPGGVGSTS